jgi:hypothetical protein
MLVAWLHRLHGDERPIPPIVTSLLRLHGFGLDGPSIGYNPDTTANQKYTSYQV